MKDSVFIEESNHFDYIQKEINTVIINDDQLINQLSTSIQDDIGFDDQENIKLKINHRKNVLMKGMNFKNIKKNHIMDELILIKIILRQDIILERTVL